MKLTQKLLGLLNSVFDKDPHGFVALRLRYGGSMSWSISDQVLTTVVAGGPGVGLSVDLTQHTIGSLVQYLAGQAGYTVAFMDASRAGLAAHVLLDGSGDQATSNGDHLYGYTSLLWAYMEAVAVELEAAELAAATAPNQLNLVDGEGMWLDQVGSYYGVTRNTGETDVQYGPRVIAEAFRPRSNNIAIENAIQVYTGQTAQVVDVTVYGGAVPLYNGAINYDGTHVHNGGSSPLYGLFDVNYNYDLLGGADPSSFAATVRSIVEKLRAAGTHLRALALQGAALTDALTPPTDGSTLAVAATLADPLTAPTETVSTIPLVMATLLDTLTGPTDLVDDMVEKLFYEHTALRTYNGAVPHSGFYTRDESMSGATVNSLTAMDWASLDFAASTYRRGLFYSTSLSNFPGLSFSGGVQASGGVATGTTAQGAIASFPARPNLLLQSQTFDNISWGKSGATVSADAIAAPDGTLTADKIAETAILGAHDVSQTATVTTATSYTLSVFAKAAERSQIQLQYFDGTTNKFPIFSLLDGTKVVDNGIGSAWTATALLDGWWRFTITVTSAGTSAQCFVYAALGGTNSYQGVLGSGIYVWGAQLEPGIIAYHYKPTTSAVVWSCDPRVVPASRTNLLTQSQNIVAGAGGWVAGTGNTITGNAATAPDGTFTASSLQQDTSTGLHRLANNQLTLNGTTAYALTIYAKANGTRYLYINAGSYTGASVCFDLQTGVVAATASGAGSISALANGWYRLTVTATSAAAPSNTWFIALNQTGVATDSSYTGDGASGVYLWGAQLEQASTASAYIATTTAAITVFDQPLVRTNLALWSGDVSNAQWQAVVSAVKTGVTATAPDGTATAQQVDFSAALGANATLRQAAIATVNGSTYIWSVWLWATGADVGKTITIDVSSGTGAAVVTLTATPTRYWVSNVAGATSTQPRVISATGNTASKVFVWGGQYELGTFATAYIPTTTAAVTAVAQPTVATTGSGLLDEESRTNLTLQSGDPTQAAWTKGNCAATTDASVTTPQGTFSTKVAGVGLSFAGISQAVTVSGSTTYTAQIALEKGSGVGVVFSLSDGTSNWLLNMNTTTGAVATNGNNTGTFVSFSNPAKALANGFWLYTVTVTTAAAATSLTMAAYAAPAFARVTAAATTDYYRFAFAQLEAGATASSYIPTTSAAGVRAADVMSISGLNLTTPGTVMARVLWNTAITPVSIYVEGNAVSGVSLSNASAGAQGRIIVRHGSARMDTGGSAPPANGSVVTMAASYSAAGAVAAQNGVTETSISTPAQADWQNPIYIGCRSGNSFWANTFIQKVVFAPTLMSQAALNVAA